MSGKTILLFCASIATLAGLFIGWVHSIEEPREVGESSALIYAGLFHLLWFVPYIFLNKEKKYKQGIFILVIFLLPLVWINVYDASFDSGRWKSEIDYNRSYDGCYYHTNGSMVADLIESKILIGCSVSEMEKVLGRVYFMRSDSVVTSYFFPYVSTNVYDGCDKVLVQFKNGKCFNVDYGGCD
jgi:hypothetical protein